MICNCRFMLFGIALATVMMLTPIVAAVSHDGPVDGNGCHLDNKGRFHCH